MKRFVFAIIVFVLFVYAYAFVYANNTKEEDPMENIDSWDFEQDHHSYIIFCRGDNFCIVHNPDCNYCWQTE